MDMVLALILVVDLAQIDVLMMWTVPVMKSVVLMVAVGDVRSLRLLLENNSNN